MFKRPLLALFLSLGLLTGSAVAWNDAPSSDDPARQPSEEPSRPTGSPVLEALKKYQPRPEASEEDAEQSEAELAADNAIQEPAKPDQQRIPTPAELIRQMREQRAAEQAKTLVAQIDFSIPLQEQPAGASIFGEAGGLDLRTVLTRLGKAEQDESCKAVLLTFYNGGMMNFAQAQELIGALESLRKAGKRTFVYADTYDTLSYLIASAATDVVLMDGGELFMPGISIEPMFYRGALEKLGVEPDFIQVGEYKGAEEPYTRTEPSEELAGEMNRLADAMYGQIVEQIASNRNMRPSEVRSVIDRAMISSADAVRLGLVDHLADADGVRPLLNGEFENDVRIAADYGIEKKQKADPDNPFALLAMFAPREVKTSGPSIALIYAEGVINSGESGGGGLFGGEGVGSETIRRALRNAERDENVKAIVIRIDSPGGSALASEAMYQAIRRVAEKKPVIISIGGMAASGGYYIAVAGEHIVADPAAIIGSIGVVGGKMVMAGLYEKVGLSTASFSRGKNANLFSSSEPWDARQRKLVRDWMKSTYDQFTDRVMSTREGKIQDIDQVARGRIFLAKDGLALGMVDELGGIELALSRAAERAEIEDYEVVVMPEPQFNPFSGMGLPFLQGNSESAILWRMMPADVREALGRTIVLGELLEQRPVVLISPYAIRIR